MKRIVATVAALAAIMIAAVSVRAQDAHGSGKGPKGGPHGDRFAQMDTNGNGVIDRDEFRGPPEVFAKIDTDNSGTLTKEELKAHRDAHRGPEGTPEERFKKMDANGNGVIDRDEFRGPPEMFARIDTDNSGTLTKEELKAAHEKMQQHAGERHREHGGDNPAP